MFSPPDLPNDDLAFATLQAMRAAWPIAKRYREAAIVDYKAARSSAWRSYIIARDEARAAYDEALNDANAIMDAAVAAARSAQGQ